LLVLPDFCQLMGLYFRVAGSFIAVGANDIDNLLALLRPFRHCSGNPEFRIIWMGGYHQDIRWFRHCQPPCSILPVNDFFYDDAQQLFKVTYIASDQIDLSILKVTFSC
jgi:hypothetical protein